MTIEVKSVVLTTLLGGSIQRGQPNGFYWMRKSTHQIAMILNWVGVGVVGSKGKGGIQCVR